MLDEKHEDYVAHKEGYPAGFSISCCRAGSIYSHITVVCYIDSQCKGETRSEKGNFKMYSVPNL